MNRPRLITFAPLLLCAFALSACSMVSGKRKPDGTLIITSWRTLWKSEAISFRVAGTNFNAELAIGKSTTDAASVAAVTEGAVKAILKP